MKAIERILVPTDFSPTANDALLYALDLAQVVGAKVYIFHAARIPSASIATSAYPIGYYEALNMDELRQEAEKKMENLRHNFLYDPKVTYECITEVGPAADLIGQMAQEKKIDLLVMGARHAEGAETWFGSITTSMVKNSNCSVLVVPQGVRFVRPQKLVFATTLDKLTPLAGLDVLRVFAKTFGAAVDVLHIHAYGKDYTPEQNKFREALDQYLTEISHRFTFVASKDVSKGIQHYFESHDADMLVMLPQPHSMLDELLHTSKTRYMVFRTQKPLLAVKA
ncbi:MAG: universal stress protein [Cyclobacteriaceae bacterium]